MRTNLLLLSVGLLCYSFSNAQTDTPIVRASLESNSAVYVDDPVLGAAPNDNFASNDYLKLDYTQGSFSAGLQIESYLPALYGFEVGNYTGGKTMFLASKYIKWSGDGLAIQVGDIYEQFGNGLVYRSFEDRNLGFNNSLEGIHVTIEPFRGLRVKALAGRPRLYVDYAGSMLRGADVTLSLTQMLDWHTFDLALEACYLSRYEELNTAILVDNVDIYSLGANFNLGGLSAKAEYASKTKDLAGPNASDLHTGAAIFAEGVYTGRNFSASATFRIIDHMGTMSTLMGNGTGNVLNYLPSLSRQYHYSLANLNPHQVDIIGETSGALDMYYTLRSSSSRSKYFVFHANTSLSTTISPDQTDNGSVRLTWMDANFDLSCHWNRKFVTNFLFSRQQWSPTHGINEGYLVSNILVGEAQYKFNRNYSVRGELQYLYSEDHDKYINDEGDWMAGLVEFSLSPRVNVFVSDMYNHGGSKVHYYSAGMSFSKGNTRLQLSYGRNRAGYVCSGGVCRFSPAYTGLNVLLTSLF